MLERMFDSLLFWNIVSYIILFIAFVLIVYVIIDISKDVKKPIEIRIDGSGQVIRDQSGSSKNNNNNRQSGQNARISTDAQRGGLKQYQIQQEQLKLTLHIALKDKIIDKNL